MHAVTQEMVATDARIATLVRVMARSLLGPRISCRHRSLSVPPNQIHESIMSDAVTRVSETDTRVTTYVPARSLVRTRRVARGTLDERGSSSDV